MAIPGELRVVDDVASAFAAEMAEAFRSRAQDPFSIALTGDPTARRCYEHLAQQDSSLIDWWKVDVYWADERCVPHDDPDSNYYLAREALLDRVGAANATHLMRCNEGADSYQLRLGDLGHFDVVHLGLGTDGHTASLFVDSPALSADPGRLVTMNQDPSGNHPHERMTLTFAGIARAHLALVTVSGEDKADAMATMARDNSLPGSQISAERVLWLVDQAAAARLS